MRRHVPVDGPECLGIARYSPERKALDHSSAWALLFPGDQTAASITISEHNVLSCPAARAQ